MGYYTNQMAAELLARLAREVKKRRDKMKSRRGGPGKQTGNLAAGIKKTEYGKGSEDDRQDA